MIADGRPSLTAFTAAAARAAHLIIDDDPPIFADTWAGTMLGDQAEELIGYHRIHGTHPVLAGARAQVACRSRYTEDSLAAAVRRTVPHRSRQDAPSVRPADAGAQKSTISCRARGMVRH